MTKLNWNNLRETPIGHLVALLRALEYNSYVTEVNIGRSFIFGQYSVSITIFQLIHEPMI